MDARALVESDPWLTPYRGALDARQARYEARLKQLGDLLGPISLGHLYFGLTRGERNGEPGVWYREWAPGARGLALTGDFNGWDRRSHPLTREANGVWTLFLPDSEYRHRLTHGSRVKVHVTTDARGGEDRLPAYLRRAVQDEASKDFTGVYWNPPDPHPFRHEAPTLKSGLRIYEAHVGMALEEERIGTFREFEERLLPYVQNLGYNAVQLMGVMEHPYYGSFGYHVSNFFAVSSRFGTPEDLKRLIDAAHARGILVLMDLVHSHAVKNTREGLYLFDGTDHQYFHAGARGYHKAWDSMVFDYGKPEVLHFLLSNLRYWMDTYRFDGFRFDGVTSMLYLDHGLGRTFGHYDDYFGGNVDEDAVTYLKLVNTLAHRLNPRAITIAEDVSGMPGMARPVEEGGLGFDYRLAMGVPDYWIKVVKERRDEEWGLQDIWQVLMNRRRAEQHVGYAESHDQALVGDKTLAFRLMDQEMYWNMAKGKPSVVVDRGLGLHKLIRLLTFSLSGEAWLAFMGNEFGHPEWIDFPREGNNWSFRYARRQWSLAERKDLRYHGLLEFDRALMRLDERFHLLQDRLIEQLWVDEGAKYIAYRRGPLVFVVNLHPTQSYPDLRIPVPEARDYAVVLDTDRPEFEGHGRVAEGVRYPWQKVPMGGHGQSIQLYLPSRSAQVLAPL
ncbi:MAG TPA: alpha-amylase family glycosyl hydrolase [Candidatus Thermoplasmatota archaeon]|nr:alpha-amylase family glycosyl hydrolase [Candidatus Thermoplasmatota archaeon]